MALPAWRRPPNRRPYTMAPKKQSGVKRKPARQEVVAEEMADEDELSSPLPSDDDDEGAAAPTGLERGARRLDAARARELEDARAEQAELQVQEYEAYELPTGEELEREAAAPTLAAVRRRIQDVARVLTNFKQLRQPGRSRQEYMDRLKEDLASYYGCVGSRQACQTAWPGADTCDASVPGTTNSFSTTC
jgi:hypothetical protein